MEYCPLLLIEQAEACVFLSACVACWSASFRESTSPVVSCLLLKCPTSTDGLRKNSTKMGNAVRDR